MYYAVNKVSIGYTRPQGFVLYCSDSCEFLEFSTTEVLRMLKADGPGICGLKLIDGKIELDEQGFHQQNLTVKSSMSMGKYRLMKPNGRIEGRRLHTIVKAIDTGKDGMIYEVVTNTYSRVILTEAGIRRLYDEGVIAGLWIDSKTGQITLAERIPIVDVEEYDNGGEKEKEEEQGGEHNNSDISGNGISAAGDNATADGTCNESDLLADSLVVSDEKTADLSVFDEIETDGDNGIIFEADPELVDDKVQAININDDMSQIGAGYREKSTGTATKKTTTNKSKKTQKSAGKVSSKTKAVEKSRVKK